MDHQSTYAFNAAGLLTSMTDADGRTITYGYDAIGERTSETWVSGSYTATYQYNAAGALTQASDPNSVYTYTYDADGRETSVSNAGTPGVPTVSLSYAYDSHGDRTSLTDSLGGKISYSYDNDLRMSSLSLYTTSLHTLILDAQVTFSYNGGSLVTGVSLTATGGSTITSSMSYDNANQLTNITDKVGSTTLANYTYGYDVGGELTSYQDNNSSSLTYGYDSNGELTSAAGTLNGSSYSVSFSYDANGNRNMTGYSTGSGNELTSDGTYSYTYDHDGNTLTQTNISTGTVTNYTWDYRNRLTEVKVETSGGTVLNDETFTYDVNNNRIAVSLNGTAQLYSVYDGANPYIDFNGSGTLTERYLTNPRALNQFYGQVNASGTVQWFLTDNINSIRQVVSVSGSVLDRITYDPFGTIVNQTNASNAPRVLYAGGAIDSITGGYNFGRREENPTIGRWTSQDPLGLSPDSNPYRYVYNDPMILNDETGESYTYIYRWDLKEYQLVTFTSDWRTGQHIGPNNVIVHFPPKPPPGWFSKPNDPTELPDGTPLTAGSLPNILNPDKTVAEAFQEGLPTIIVLAQVGMIWDASGGAFVRPSQFYNPSNFFRNRPGGFTGSCFAAGTPLLTPWGDKAIEQFRVGDKILSRSELDPNGELETKVVEEVFVRTAKIVHLRVGGRTIATTAEHPFWVKGKGWQMVSELRAGDLLSSHDVQWVAVEGVQDTRDETTVYNLRIADYHTYFIGARDWGFSIWAHNAKYDIQQIRNIGTQNGWDNKTTKAFGDFVVELKESGYWEGVNPRGTLTWEQLQDAARYFAEIWGL